MKKLIIIFILSLFVSPIAKASTLYGFADGNYYDSTETLQYICFLDNSCLKSDGTQATREALGLNDIPTTTPISSLPANTPTTVYVPVYIPSSTGANVLVGGTPQSTTSPITLIPDPSFTATSIPASGTQVTLGQWVVTNNTNIDAKISYTLLTFNFTGNNQSNEGFNNESFLVNGGSYTTGGFNNNNYSLGGNVFTIAANSSDILKIIADPIFNNPTNIIAIRTDIQLNYGINSLSASGTTLSIIH